MNEVGNPHWPETLRAFACVLFALFRRRGRDEATARQEAEAAILELAAYAGGRPIYFPNARRLKTVLQNEAIWRDFNGTNKRELADKFGLSVRAVEIVIKNRGKS